LHTPYTQTKVETLRQHGARLACITQPPITDFIHVNFVNERGKCLIECRALEGIEIGQQSKQRKADR
jgi:hypothetical protein